MCMWGVKKNGKKMKDWGNMSLSEDGYVFWTRGAMWFSLAQFRDNVLLATNLPPLCSHGRLGITVRRPPHQPDTRTQGVPCSHTHTHTHTHDNRKREQSKKAVKEKSSRAAGQP